MRDVDVGNAGVGKADLVDWYRLISKARPDLKRLEDSTQRRSKQPRPDGDRRPSSRSNICDAPPALTPTMLARAGRQLHQNSRVWFA
jgi:hypothetical protein